MLQSVVGKPHPKGILFLINPIPDNLILLLDQLDQVTPHYNRIGNRTIASSDSLELGGEPVGQPQSLLVDVTVFPVAQSKLWK
jgi:hypothetical protein